MLQTTLTLPFRKGGVLRTQTQVHDSRCCKPLLSCPLARGGVLHTQTPVHDYRCCKPLVPCLFERGESDAPKLKCMTPDVANHFSRDHSKVGVLPTQTPVHDSRCCKQHLSYKLARRESYPPKLQCMTPDVPNHFYPDH